MVVRKDRRDRRAIYSDTRYEKTDETKRKNAESEITINLKVTHSARITN